MISLRKFSCQNMASAIQSTLFRKQSASLAFLRSALIAAMFATLLPLPSFIFSDCKAAEPPVYDVVIYGGTSAGIVAAVQAKRMGASVIVLEPSTRIGGLTTGGLGQTDIGNKAAIGGISREFYQGIRQYYNDPANWNWQTPESYRSGGQSRTIESEDTMWTFEPSAALHVMTQLAAEHHVEIVLNAKLDRTLLNQQNARTRGVTMNERRIEAITTTNQITYRGHCFIDATYEGDLLAGAGVSYTVGRESNSTYEETLNGVQTKRAIHHQLQLGVSSLPNCERPKQRSPSGDRYNWARSRRAAGSPRPSILFPHVSNRSVAKPTESRKTFRL